MKISGQTVNDEISGFDKRVEEQRRSGKFSQIFKERERKDSRKDPAAKEHGAKEGGSGVVAAAASAAKSGPLIPAATAPDVAGTALKTGPEPTGGKKTGTAERPADAHMAKLAHELVQKLDAVRQDGKVQGVNITFTSKALEGLHVQIRKQEGGVAIRFITSSEPLSNLLTKNTGQLRDSLAQKGVSVASIAISAQQHRASGDPGEPVTNG